MHDELRRQLGPDVDIAELQEQYRDAQLMGSREAKQFKKDNPELQAYYDLKDRYQTIIDGAIIRASENIGTAKYPALRGPGTSLGSTKLYGELSQQETQPTPYTMGWTELTSELTPTLLRVLVDSIYSGQDLSYAAESQLTYQAEKYGLTFDLYYQLLQQAAP